MATLLRLPLSSLVLMALVLVACVPAAPASGGAAAKPAAGAPHGSAAAPATAAQSAPAKPASGEPYRIGVTAALTGPLADSFAPVYEALNVYFQRLNEAGGIDGHPVQVLIEDDGGDATRATSNATKLLQQERVPILFVSTTSATYGPLMNLARTANVPLFIASVCPREAFPPADPLIFCSSSFGALYDSAFAIGFLKDTAREPVRLGLVALDVPVSRTSIDYAGELATEAGMQVVSKQVIPATATDFTPFATQLQQAGANWVFAWAPWSTEIGPYDALQKLGWRGNYLLWAHQPAEEELLRRRADNLYAFGGNALFADDLPVHRDIRAAVDRYKTTYPVEYMAEGWSAALALEQALRNCGWPCDAAGLQGALGRLDVDMKGLRGGSLAFSGDNHYRTKAYYKVYRWDPSQSRIVAARDWGALEVVPGR